MAVWLPKSRRFAKNHSLSRLIGPPSEPLTSHSLMRPAASVTPCAFSASSTLCPCAQLPAPEPNPVPEYRLPPVFGTRFMIGPPVSASPRLPEIEICISCAFATSYAFPDTPPPLNAVPSLPGPPCAVKKLGLTDDDELAPAPCRLGTAARIDP